ncbi:hypothetical protein HQ563_00200 [bacterium]|nr:hypothetical protein [bacterium]
MIYCCEMEPVFRKEVPRHKWLVFISVSLCIAAVGVSSRFFVLERKEREKRIAAENGLRTLRSEIRLLEEKNRDLAEQLREAKRVAQNLARERESAAMAATEVSSSRELPGSEPVSEETTLPQPQEVKRLADAVKDLRLERVALAANRVRETAGRAWRVMRTAIAPSVRVARVLRSSASAETPRLSDVMKRFPIDGLARIATEAKSSARKAIGAVGSVFSSVGETSVASVSPRVPAPSVRSGKLTATNEDLRRELADVRQEKRDLEKQIAERTGEIPGSVDVGQVRITTGRRFSGKVLVVNRKHNFVIIDVGKNQGLEKGEVFIVHRGNDFIGKAQVIKVYEKMAAADLIMDWMQEEVQVNDGVKKF